MRQIDFDILVHPRRDPACAREAHSFLRPFVHQFTHALVVYDHQGSGFEHRASGDVGREVAEKLAHDWDIEPAWLFWTPNSKYGSLLIRLMWNIAWDGVGRHGYVVG